MPVKRTAKITRKRTKIGFVGLGRMGANMARRLKDCGYPITAVHDSNRAVAEDLADELGAVAVSKLSDVTASAQVVITVVSDDAAMKQIFSGKKDNLLQGADGTLFINCATVSPSVHVEVEALANAAGANSLKLAWHRRFRRRVKARCI